MANAHRCGTQATSVAGVGAVPRAALLPNVPHTRHADDVLANEGDDVNDLAAFHRAIRANPDCDTTRLVFADWIDDNADVLSERERATSEYIRLTLQQRASKKDERRWLIENWQRLLLPLLNLKTQLSGLMCDEIDTFVTLISTSTCHRFINIKVSFSRGLASVLESNDADIWAVAADACPVARLSVAFAIQRLTPNQVAVADFNPRSAWLSIPCEHIDTDGTSDLKVFTGADARERATLALSDALRAHGESVNAKNLERMEFAHD